METYSKARRIRDAQKISRERLARLADVSSATVFRLEQGQAIGTDNAQAIARALGVTVNDLLEEEVSA